VYGFKKRIEEIQSDIMNGDKDGIDTTSKVIIIDNTVDNRQNNNAFDDTILNEVII